MSSSRRSVSRISHEDAHQYPVEGADFKLVFRLSSADGEGRTVLSLQHHWLFGKRCKGKKVDVIVKPLTKWELVDAIPATTEETVASTNSVTSCALELGQSPSFKEEFTKAITLDRTSFRVIRSTDDGKLQWSYYLEESARHSTHFVEQKCSFKDADSYAITVRVTVSHGIEGRVHSFQCNAKHPKKKQKIIGFVVGNPKAGKSFLLNKFRQQLSKDNATPFDASLPLLTRDSIIRAQDNVVLLDTADRVFSSSNAIDRRLLEKLKGGLKAETNLYVESDWDSANAFDQTNRVDKFVIVSPAYLLQEKTRQGFFQSWFSDGWKDAPQTNFDTLRELCELVKSAQGSSPFLAVTFIDKYQLPLDEMKINLAMKVGVPESCIFLFGLQCPSTQEQKCGNPDCDHNLKENPDCRFYYPCSNNADCKHDWSQLSQTEASRLVNSITAS